MYIEIVFCKGFLTVIGNQCSRKLRRKQSDMTKKEIFCSNSIRMVVGFTTYAISAYHQ
jgi:hypothetical protein